MSIHRAWSKTFEPPAPISTARFCLEVLGPELAELDFAAIMGSRVRLRAELQWGSKRRWPPDDFTLEENRIDLQNHYAEYERREAYAYSVLSPTRSACIGCIYIEQIAIGARLAFWVIDDELETKLETHLLEAVRTWLCATWGFERVMICLRPTNRRGIEVLESLGFSSEIQGGLREHRSFAWQLA